MTKFECMICEQMKPDDEAHAETMMRGVCDRCFTDAKIGHLVRAGKSIACPWCHESGFDLIGLKTHIAGRWCQGYNECECGGGEKGTKA